MLHSKVAKTKTSPHVRQKYDEAHARLESARKDYRNISRKLVTTIHCDGKDVLGVSEIKEVKAAFSALLRAQRRLLTVFWRANKTTARLLHEASQGDPETEA